MIAPPSWRAWWNAAPAACSACVATKFPLPRTPNASRTPSEASVRPTASAAFIGAPYLRATWWATVVGHGLLDRIPTQAGSPRRAGARPSARRRGAHAARLRARLGGRPRAPEHRAVVQRGDAALARAGQGARRPEPARD